jgi:hypothetical protein
MSNPILKHRGVIYPIKDLCKKIIFLAHGSFFISTFSLQAQCINTGYKNASNFSTDNTVGVYNFSSPSNAQASDNVKAVASSLVAVLSGDTYYLKATGFNFSIPSYASICGITVQVEHRATGLILTAAVKDNVIKLIKNGTITGNNKSNAANWGTTDTYFTYGGSSDLWGTSLIPDDVNASNFGIAFSANITALVAALPTVEIDHIQMSIDYYPMLPVSFLYFKSEKKNNGINLEWETGEEEDNAFVELQRSLNGGGWQTLTRFEMHFINSKKIYNYTDDIHETGVYAYRLKTTLASRQTSYSSIIETTFTRNNAISLYPFPAKDYVTIDNIPCAETVSVVNLQAQRFNLVPERISNSSFRLHIQRLPKGIYFAMIDNQAIRFLKQ